MKKLLNPRGYLSWTQIDLWMRNPNLYIRRYVYGEAEFKNERMDFGSKVAHALETGEPTDDETINTLVALLPGGGIAEHEIRATLKTKVGEVELLGKLDRFYPEDKSFRETKTGTTKWTQARADGHKQLDHYSALIWLAYSVVPKIHLDWAPTSYDMGLVELTGDIQTFEVKKTLTNVFEYLALAGKVAREIDIAYRAELKKNT